ncbi:MAG: PD-(D/E)XK nuclease family protein [Candidatus Bipolaricaulis sp.]|nr:PD-(D/E)XK nuclease family protein [Candidatus Bipolaricaulis sp.]
MARYSYSKLGAYRTCPLQYRFRYIDKVRVDVAPSIEAFMGSRVHDALEGLYRHVVNGRSPGRDEVLSLYEARWDAERTGDLRIVDDTLDEAAYRAAGRRCLELYVARYAPFNDGIVIGLEEGFQIALGGGLVLNGVIDRLMKRADGVYEVHDYKTSRRLPTPEEARVDEQGGWYALAVRRRFPHARDIRLVWHYLRYDEELVSTRTPQETEELEKDIVRRVRAIEAAADFPALESRLCDWCDYRSVCPAKGHSLAVAALPPNEYLNEPGVMLVNRLAGLKTTLKTAAAAAEDEIVRIEEALLAYAREHGYTVVVGAEMEAVIGESADLKLPKKDDPRRPALEDTVRQLGLWDRVSDLNLTKLEKTLTENTLPSDARRRIEPFTATEPKTTVRLRKRRATTDR